MSNVERLLIDVGPKGLALIGGTIAAGLGLKESLFSGEFVVFLLMTSPVESGYRSC